MSINKISQIIGENVSGDMRKAYNILEQVRFISKKSVNNIADHIFYIVHGVDKNLLNELSNNLYEIVNTKELVDRHLHVYTVIDDFMAANSIAFSRLINLIIYICKEKQNYFVLKEMSGLVFRYNKISYDMERVYMLSLCNLLSKYL